MTYRRYRTTRRGARAVALSSLVVAVLVGVEAGAQARQGTEPPAEPVVAAGVTAGGVDLSGLTAAEAEKALLTHASRPLTLSLRWQTWRFAPASLGASTDVQAAVRAVMAAPPGAAVRLDVIVDGRRLKRWARDFARDFDRPAKNARVVLRDTKLRATRSRLGREVFRSSLRTAITSELRANDRGPLALPVRVVRPKVTRGRLGAAIVIRRASNTLLLYRGGGPTGMRVVRRFGVATGMAAYPTPLGSFTIVDLQRDPWWYPPDSDWAEGAEPVPPGPGNPLGTRWMGLSEPLIGIHGTPDAASIGYSASHGCVRMRVPEAEWLFERVREGTPVFILDA